MSDKHLRYPVNRDMRMGMGVSPRAIDSVRVSECIHEKHGQKSLLIGNWTGVLGDVGESFGSRSACIKP
jgi:hypothetical protein